MQINVNINVRLSLYSMITMHLMCLVSTCSKTISCFPDTTTTQEKIKAAFSLLHLTNSSKLDLISAPGGSLIGYTFILLIFIAFNEMK